MNSKISKLSENLCIANYIYHSTSKLSSNNNLWLSKQSCSHQIMGMR